MEEPWEALDVDDSDLSSFRRPPKRRQALIDPPISSSVLRPCSSRSSQQPPSQHPSPQSPNSVSFPPLEPPPTREKAKGERRIPGPAGAVRAAMQRRARRSEEGFPRRGGEEEEEDATAIPTQEYIRRALENGDDDEGDFTLDPWVRAVEFVRRQGLVDGDGDGDGDGVAIGTPLCSIKRGAVPDKASQVVAIVKSCTPNGLGDMMVTLKDPTGTFGATIHRKVLREKGFAKEISVGAVLILQKVAVFSPSRRTCYLNITLNNIIKVVAKDGGRPSKENCSPPAEKSSSSLEIWKKSSTQEQPSSQLRGRIEGILSSLKQATNSKERTVGFLQYEQSGGVQGTDSHSNQTSSNNDVSMVNKSPPVTHDETSQLKAAGSGETMDCSTSANTKCNYSRLGIAEVSDDKEGVSVDGMRQQQQQLSSRNSILQWTDEQLEELMDCE